MAAAAAADVDDSAGMDGDTGNGSLLRSAEDSEAFQMESVLWGRMAGEASGRRRWNSDEASDLPASLLTPKEDTPRRRAQEDSRAVVMQRNCPGDARLRLQALSWSSGGHFLLLLEDGEDSSESQKAKLNFLFPSLCIGG